MTAQRRISELSRQTPPSEQTKKALVQPRNLSIKTLFFFPVERILFFMLPRFEILVDGYNSLDRNINSLLSTVPSPRQEGSTVEVDSSEKSGVDYPRLSRS